MFMRNTALSLVAMSTLAACGGGGGGGTEEISGPVYIGLSDTTSSQISALQSHQFDDEATVTSSTGTLTRAANGFTLGDLAGSIDPTRATVTLDGGGTVTLNAASTSFVAMYSVESISSSATGVVGTPTTSSDLPTSGLVSYAGSSIIGINDGEAFYNLTGSALAKVTFGSGSGDVDMTFTDLNGTKEGPASGATVVTEVVTITIDSAVIANGVFTGGTATLDSTQITATLSGDEIVSTSGGFYGPGADEIGGVFVIDDTAGGSLTLQGSFLAD